MLFHASKVMKDSLREEKLELRTARSLIPVATESVIMNAYLK